MSNQVSRKTSTSTARTVSEDPPQIELNWSPTELEEQFKQLLEEIAALGLGPDLSESPLESTKTLCFQENETQGFGNSLNRKRTGTIIRKLNRISLAVHELQSKWDMNNVRDSLYEKDTLEHLMLKVTTVSKRLDDQRCSLRMVQARAPLQPIRIEAQSWPNTKPETPKKRSLLKRLFN